MVENKDLYREIMAIHARARHQFNGQVVAKYDDVIDFIHIPKRQEEIEALGRRLGEPVLLSMGNVDMLFIPNNDRAQAVFGDSFSSQEGWLPSLCHETETVLNHEDLSRLALFSGASGSEQAKYSLDVDCGADLTVIRARLQDLGEKGLDITTNGNGGEILSSQQFLPEYTVIEPSSF